MKLATQQATSSSFADTGEQASGARNTSEATVQSIIEKRIEEIREIREEQQRNAKHSFELDLSKQFKELERKRIRYESRRKNREFGLKRQRQKRLVGKRHHMANRVWEKGMIVKHAYDRFHGRS